MEALDEDAALTLAEACRIYFRGAIKPASLRSAARQGKLTIVRVGRTDFVTPAAIRQMMVTKCPENDSRPASTSGRTTAHGSSETERNLSAQAAMLATAEALKKRSRPTSVKSSSRPSASVIRLASPSQKS